MHSYLALTMINQFLYRPPSDQERKNKNKNNEVFTVGFRPVPVGISKEELIEQLNADYDGNVINVRFSTGKNAVVFVDFSSASSALAAAKGLHGAECYGKEAISKRIVAWIPELTASKLRSESHLASNSNNGVSSAKQPVKKPFSIESLISSPSSSLSSLTSKKRNLAFSSGNNNDVSEVIREIETDLLKCGSYRTAAAADSLQRNRKNQFLVPDYFSYK
jgi:hypothetical protein